MGLALLALAPAVVPLLIVRIGFLRGKGQPDSRVVDWMAERGVTRPDRWVYRVMMFTFWMSLGVVPAILFFESAWELDTVSLSRQEARWWHDQTAKRLQGIESEWSDLADPTYLRAREASWSDRYPVFPLLPVCPDSTAAPAAVCRSARASALHGGTSHALVPLARLLPAYNTTSGRLRYQWKGPVPDVGPELATRDAGTPESRDNVGFRARWILAVVLLSLMAVIWFWIRFVSRHFALRFFQRPDPGPTLKNLVVRRPHKRSVPARWGAGSSSSHPTNTGRCCASVRPSSWSICRRRSR